MKLASCKGCGGPVLELEGQFSKLDSLYINSEPPPGTPGWWHASCLAESEFAPFWYEARLRNFRDVRRYQVVADYPQWTVLRDPNRGKALAFGRTGEILSLSRGNRKAARVVDGGSIYPTVEEEYHLELEDPGLVRTLQEALLDVGTFPLSIVLNELGVANRVIHPEALENGAFYFNNSLQHEWDNRFASATVKYGVFVPSELEPHVGDFVR